MSTTPENDESLLTRASILERLGTSDSKIREMAWADFRKRYVPVISGFASRCGAARQDLEDIVQDVLTAFVGKQGEFVYDPSRGRFRGYLKTCAVRATIRRAGKNARFRGVPLDEISDADQAVEPVWNDIWEKELISQALTEVKSQRENDVTFQAFEQYVLLARSSDIVATELGISVNSVHQAKTRITKELRDAVQRLKDSE
jgi:RNA polymerase sigma-70 factor (ECF subfamily)